jgi:nucleoid-associated protein YgaU
MDQSDFNPFPRRAVTVRARRWWISRVSRFCWTLLLIAVPACEDSAQKIQTTSAPVEVSDPVPKRKDRPRDEEFVESGTVPGRVHRVQPHDTLTKLAQQYYGDRKLWRRIWQANRKRIVDPDNLPVGMMLIIP